MNAPSIPPPPGPDVPTQPHPTPLPDDPLKGPTLPPDIGQPGAPENPTLPHPVNPPSPSPAPTEPPVWG